MRIAMEQINVISTLVIIYLIGSTETDSASSRLLARQSTRLERRASQHGHRVDAAQYPQILPLKAADIFRTGSAF
jgi:hypothetical protein